MWDIPYAYTANSRCHRYLKDTHETDVFEIIALQFQPPINVGDTLVTVAGKNVYGLSLTTLRYADAVVWG